MSRALAKSTHRSKSSIPHGFGRTRDTSAAISFASPSFSPNRISTTGLPAKSFRHDIKNHLSVLDGLLRGGKLEEGREYLKKLEAVSEALSRPVVLFRHRFDVGKSGARRGQGFVRAGVLKGQHVEISLLLPADADGLGPIVCAAGGDGVVQGVSEEHTQVKIVNPTGEKRTAVLSECVAEYFAL
mgnify:CR=1 FL=1